MYEDYEDIFEEEDTINGIPLSNFGTFSFDQKVYDTSAPYFIGDYIKTIQSVLLLTLLGFQEEFSRQTWIFPKEIDIVTIEHLTLAKLFSKRNLPLKRNAKMTTTNDHNILPHKMGTEDKSDDVEKRHRTRDDGLNIKSAKVGILLL